MEERVVGHRLRQALEQQHSGDDGVIGKVAGEVRLVESERAHADDLRFRQLDDPIDEQKRRPMRKHGGDIRQGHDGARNTTEALVPPKPNEFLRMVRGR